MENINLENHKPNYGTNKVYEQIPAFNPELELDIESNNGAPPLQLIQSKEKTKQKPAYFTILLIILQISVMIAMIVYNRGIEDLKLNPLIGPSDSVLLKFGVKNNKDILENRQYWRFFTSIWLNGGTISLVANLVFMLIVGPPIERQIGFGKMMVIYIITSSAGVAASCIFIPTENVAGATYAGFVGLYVVETAKNKFEKEYKKIIIVCFSAFISFILGFTPSCDNFSQLFTFLTALLIGMVVVKPGYLSETKTSCFEFFLLFFAFSIIFLEFFFLFYYHIMEDWCGICVLLNCVTITNWGINWCPKIN